MRLSRHRTEAVTWVRAASTTLPTRHGTFDAHGYRGPHGVEHLALVMGDVAGAVDVPVRVHSECLTGEALGSLHCDCGEQLDAALEHVGQAGRGVVVYLRGHEGRGIGLVNKLRAYGLQDQGADTASANTLLGLPVDQRSFEAAAVVLADLGVVSVALMTNSPDKIEALERFGIPVSRQVPMRAEVTAFNRSYLATKRDLFSHTIVLEHA